MSTTRPIAAVDLPDLSPGTVPTGKPELTWIDPRELLVDDSYQRGIGDKGLRLIRRIVETFDWRKFKPPTAVWTQEGLEVLDGQHSAIAAATHPAVDLIPVVIVEAEEVAQRAEAFLGLNRDRLAITAIQLHAAAVVAGDEGAAAIERICSECGVTVLKVPRSGGISRPRDTVAVRALGDLVRRVGESLAVQVVRVLAEAELAPISAPALRAVEAILMGTDYAEQVEPAKLTRAIVALGVEADKEASVFAATRCVPKWRGLVAVWSQEARKRKHGVEPIDVARPDLEPEATVQPSSPPHPMRRVIIRPPVAASVSLGEPPPGRSALDQRRSGGRS